MELDNITGIHPRKAFTIAGTALRLNARAQECGNMTTGRPGYNQTVCNQSIAKGWTP
jgi:hypothetical protein